MSAEFLTTSLGAVVILGMWSMVFYKESYWSRWVEVSVIGMGAAYVVVTAMRSVYERAITPVMRGQYLFLVPIILGILTLIQFFPRYRWVVRWPMAVLMGVQLAIAVRGTLGPYFWGQISAQIDVFAVAVTPIDYLNGIIMVIVIVTSMFYFTFSIEHKGAVGVIARFGRYILMMGFGVLFTFGMLTRAGWLVATLRFLLHNWLNLI